MAKGWDVHIAFVDVDFSRGGARIRTADTVYENKERAISVARSYALALAQVRGTGDPIEDPLEKGGVLFRIPGINNYKHWPRVEAIDDN